MFKVKDQIIIRVGNKNVRGHLVGIDYYEIENFAGRKSRWPSYTLVSNHSKPFDRYWFVLWDKARWILWTASKRASTPRNADLIVEKSGLARIRFKGDAGSSTPVAALIQYKCADKYFCVERFLNSKVMIFDGHKIKKPKKLTRSKH